MKVTIQPHKNVYLDPLKHGSILCYITSNLTLDPALQLLSIAYRLIYRLYSNSLKGTHTHVELESLFT